MKIKRFIPLMLALSALASPCFAQSSKVAFIDTSVFGDPQHGINSLVRAIEHVEGEFAQRRSELAEMQMRLQRQLQEFSFVGPIPTDPRPMTRERRKEAKERAETMRLEFEQKQEEMQRAYSNRLREATAQIYEDIRRSLKAFAEARGIKILIDAGNMSCPIGCDVESAADLNITRDFIAEYNRLHP